MSKLEEEFFFQIKAAKLPKCKREFIFHCKRKFRFDFAWPKYKVAVEVDGGTWAGGRHVRGYGFKNDCIKFNLASCSGWAVLRGDSSMVKSGELLNSLIELLENRRCNYGLKKVVHG